MACCNTHYGLSAVLKAGYSDLLLYRYLRRIHIRSKVVLSSSKSSRRVLDDIEGIGPARRKALMRRYQSLEKIKEADVEDLMQTETMNEKAAQAVYAFFHSAT